MREYLSKNELNTKAVAAELMTALAGGDIICLYGELGAGKTTFTKGLAEALGIKEEITSPTFTLMNVYQVLSPQSSVLSLIHIDTYRLENEKELLAIGVDDYLGQTGTVTVVEWPEKIEGLLEGKKVIRIWFEHLEDGGRKIRVENF